MVVLLLIPLVLVVQPLQTQLVVPPVKVVPLVEPLLEVLLVVDRSLVVVHFLVVVPPLLLTANQHLSSLQLPFLPQQQSLATPSLSQRSLHFHLVVLP